MRASSKQIDTPLTLVYEDEDLVVANKPSGLLCVPGLSDPNNLHDQVLSYNANARVVHRLDMATSGLVIFALHHQSQKRLGKMFEQKDIRKSYIAIVAGTIGVEHGEIVSPLICDWDKRPKQKIDWLSGKQSHTFFTVLNREKSNSRVKLSPITGRTHQLRLHMQQIGHPILGDRLYFHQGLSDRADRLLLHAQSLHFKHPISGKELALESEADF